MSEDLDMSDYTSKEGKLVTDFPVYLSKAILEALDFRKLDKGVLETLIEAVDKYGDSQWSDGYCDGILAVPKKKEEPKSDE